MFLDRSRSSEYMKCPCDSGEYVGGLCTFPMVYSLCGAYTCTDCGEIKDRDDVRCPRHKEKPITDADLYDLTLYECLCHWGSSAQRLLEDAGREFDEHLQRQPHHGSEQ